MSKCALFAAITSWILALNARASLVIVQVNAPSLWVPAVMPSITIASIDGLSLVTLVLWIMVHGPLPRLESNKS